MDHKQSALDCLYLLFSSPQQNSKDLSWKIISIHFIFPFKAALHSQSNTMNN